MDFSVGKRGFIEQKTSSASLALVDFTSEPCFFYRMMLGPGPQDMKAFSFQHFLLRSVVLPGEGL